eukprot:TRINITY_DN9682_c0_g1_i2.p1 TRINITY_DN9682_c0_g1~~TRINITY_DN9682_c0_g1_i2.p1  ORF type:complete len:237 (+),score=48.96 TRINITY_DN9682_c0_g1_i2:116-826(+)
MENSNFLQYYRTKPKPKSSPAKPNSLPRKSQQLISKVKQKRQQLREISNSHSELKLAVTTFDRTQVEDLKRADKILRGGFGQLAGVQRSSEVLLTDGTSETELVHGMKGTLKEETIRRITQTALQHVLQSKDSILSDLNIDKYKEKLRDCEVSQQDIEIYKKRAARLGMTQILEQERTIPQTTKKFHLNKTVQNENRFASKSAFSCKNQKPIKSHANYEDTNIDIPHIRTIIRVYT